MLNVSINVVAHISRKINFTFRRSPWFIHSVSYAIQACLPSWRAARSFGTNLFLCSTTSLGNCVAYLTMREFHISNWFRFKNKIIHGLNVLVKRACVVFVALESGRDSWWHVTHVAECVVTRHWPELQGVTWKDKALSIVTKPLDKLHSSQYSGFHSTTEMICKNGIDLSHLTCCITYFNGSAIRRTIKLHGPCSRLHRARTTQCTHL